MQGKLAVLVIAIPLLAACARTSTSTSATLAVFGDATRVSDFVSSERSKHPNLKLSPIRQIADGRATATMTFAAKLAPQDVAEAADAALKRNLSYAYTGRTSTVSYRLADLPRWLTG
jgi:hypothetical protein